MRNFITYCLLFVLTSAFAQKTTQTTDDVYVFTMKQSLVQKTEGKETASINLPDDTGKMYQFILTPNSLFTKDVNTYDGRTEDNQAVLKLSFFQGKVNAMMKTPNGYFIIEPQDLQKSEYKVYSSFSKEATQFSCENHLDEELEHTLKGMNHDLGSKDIANFPTGSTLRIYRMAVATTGEFTTIYGSQDDALAEVISMVNLINLTYELETAMTFELIDKTTDKTLIFTDADTDPFTPDTSFASAAQAQIGFTEMNDDGTLTYDEYDIGHVFNTLGTPSSGSSSARGQAGPDPCTDEYKARAWSEWSTTMPIGSTANVIIHEMGHQFSAWHTYNAVGGPSSGSTFCTSGWSSTTAVEPGSGTTIMSYGNNCTNPDDQTMSGDNSLGYFNVKSLEQINASVASDACYTTSSTGNTPPEADAQADVTIPKNTPFSLKGVATDTDGDAMSYTWEQADVATTDDQGALGYAIVGTGGYTAVNSTTAPLFRSEMSTTTTERIFPKMKYVLDNANQPDDNEGEALSQVARDILFRFTVRDNKSGGGGVDTDEVTVTVSDEGPLQVSYPNTNVSLAAGGTAEIKWEVNNTNDLDDKVNILLSVDGGSNFNYTLAADVNNNGSYTVTLPNIGETEKARIKVEAVLSDYATFFDVSDVDFTITSSCEAPTAQLSNTETVTGDAGDTVFDLGLGEPVIVGDILTELSVVFESAQMTTNPIYVKTSSTDNTPYLVLSSYNSIKKIFRISESGSYTFTNSTGGFLAMSIYKGEPSEDNFMSSNAYYNGTNYSSSTSFSVDLEEGQEYQMVFTDFNSSGSGSTFDVTYTGAGDLFESESISSGYSYTYIAINDATSTIDAQSNTGDFTSLGEGDYTMYVVVYEDGVSSFVGSTLDDVLAASYCKSIGTNTRVLEVTGTTTGDYAVDPGTGDNTSSAPIGISTLQHEGDDWIAEYKGGHLVLESPTKAFVITQVDDAESAIAEPVEGMLVYDTSDNCIKLYNGTAWSCIQQVTE